MLDSNGSITLTNAEANRMIAGVVEEEGANETLSNL